MVKGVSPANSSHKLELSRCQDPVDQASLKSAGRRIQEEDLDPAAKAVDPTTRALHNLKIDNVLGSSDSLHSPYGRLSWNLAHDEIWMRDQTLGRRIGFYKFKGDLGTGNFSQVRLATHSLTDERVAVKVIDKTKLDSKTQKMLLREITTMDGSYHPHLVRLYEVLENSTKIYLVMQFAPGGELFTRLTQEGKYPESKAKIIFAQIASAINYMHGAGMIHRDIKAENVFFLHEDSVVVGDFGFACHLTSMDQHLTTFCGSPPYAAPELFQDDSYVGPWVDIWALGILLYFLNTGSTPFKASTVASLKHAILEGTFTIPAYLSHDCAHLIQNILKRKPQWRFSMKKISQHPWLAGAPWPGEDRGYRPYPCLSPLVTNLSDTEKAVRAELAGLGISPEMQREEAARGVRSPLLGTYRIVMHRLHRQIHDLPSTEASSGASLRSAAAPARRSAETKGGITVNIKQSGAAHKSKTCSIL